MRSNLFISDGYVQGRVQRTNKLLRTAGVVVIVAIAAQVAVVAGYLCISHLQDDESAQAASLASQKAAVEEKLKPYVDVQAKYAQIMGWIPLLENRLPVSAIINYVQGHLPAYYSVRDLVVRSDDLVTTPAGFRRPKSYTLDLIGYVQTGSNKKEKDVLEDMKAMFPGLPVKTLALPPGSESVSPPLWHVAVSIDPASEGVASTPAPDSSPGVAANKSDAASSSKASPKPTVAVVRPAASPRPPTAPRRKVVLDLFRVTPVPADELPAEQQ